jgi:hypothetical protein
VRKRQRFTHLDVGNPTRRAAVRDLCDLPRAQLRSDEIAAPMWFTRQSIERHFRGCQAYEAARTNNTGRWTARRRFLQSFAEVLRLAHCLFKLLARADSLRHPGVSFNRAGDLRANAVHLCIAVADDTQARTDAFEVVLSYGHSKLTVGSSAEESQSIASSPQR